MNLNLPKGTAYIAAAMAAGLVATLAIHQYVSVKTSVPQVATAQVAVAARDMAPGTALSSELVKIASWPKELVPPQAASSLSQVQGRVVTMPIAHGEPILMRKLAPTGTAAGLSGLLDHKKRALTVRVDDVSGVAGFIHPGNRVDVLADIKLPDAKDSFSKTILQNILVLTTGQIWEQKGESKPVVVNTVTLEVDPEQAEVLNLASNEGKIRLALRNPHNLELVVTDGVAMSQLFTPKAKPVSQPEPQKDTRAVEVIKGLERTQATL